MIYQSSPGLQNPDYIQPTAPPDHIEDKDQEANEPSTHKREQNIQKGSSNFINIHPKQGSNVYTDDNHDQDDDSMEFERSDEEIIEEDLEQSEWDNTEDEYFDESYEEEDDDDDDDGGDYGNYGDYGSEDKDSMIENEDSHVTETHIDPLSLEKEDHDLDQQSAKFDESEIRENSERLVAHNKKVLDNKFLKDLETPVKVQGFSSKQEEHSPYSYVGHKLSHMKPFRSFKEYLDKSQSQVKVVSTASKGKSNSTDPIFDAGDVTSQRVARNSPPTDPSRFNTEDDDPPDKRSIKKKVLHKAVSVALETKQKVKDVKNIII